MNKAAFAWGRRAALDPARRRCPDRRRRRRAERRPARFHSLDEMIARRVAFLTDYQDAAYARRYADRIAKVRAAEAAVAPQSTALTEAVARNLFKLMAYKDEYEVARLYTDGEFLKGLGAQFEGDLKLTFHLAPPILGRRDEHTGLPKKTTFGPWMLKALGVLARVQGPARRRARCLRLQPRAPDGTPPDRRVRGPARRDRRPPDRGEPPRRRVARRGSDDDPRLRARQAAQPRRSEGATGGVCCPGCGRSTTCRRWPPNRARSSSAVAVHATIVAPCHLDLRN